MTDEEKKTYLEKLNRHSEVSEKIAHYSMQRIDLLIISVSGAGIYACLEILKYIHDNKLANTLLFKIVGVLFVIAIITNFISQWTAYNANIINGNTTKLVIKNTEEGTKSEKEIATKDCYVKMLDKLTSLLNTISTCTMLIGLVCIIIFIWYIF